ncbi:MAG: PACE efflux transporter [Marinobacterium sp.]|nr:PACE efflux transporter [Marinobacterium sp.]
MRTTADRIRHTLLFETIAVVLTIYIAGLFIDNSPMEIGSLSIALSLIAMSWNYLYNLMFDKWLCKKNDGVMPRQRSGKLRITHAVLFEGGLLFATLPMVAWWLDMTLLHALVMDIGLSLFFMVYAFVFNWGYDQAFPLSEPTAVQITG